MKSGKVAKCMPYLQCFQVQMYFFYISKLNNAIYMLGVLAYTINIMYYLLVKLLT